MAKKQYPFERPMTNRRVTKKELRKLRPDLEIPKDGAKERWYGPIDDIVVNGRPAPKPTSQRTPMAPNKRYPHERSLADLKQRAASAKERQAVHTQAREAYGPGSRFSFYRDFLTLQSAEAARQAMVGRTTEPDTTIPGDQGQRYSGGPVLVPSQDVAEAQERLGTIQPQDDGHRSRTVGEQRALSTGAGAGGEFVPAVGVLPSYLVKDFAEAARAGSVLLDVFAREPLPSSGETVSSPRLVTGASVAAQTDGASVSMTDPTTSLIQSAVGLAAGRVELSRQAMDRLNPSYDTVLTRELATALGSEIDRQCLGGAGGTSGATKGLISQAGTTRTLTDATPTQSETWTAICGLLSDTVNARGRQADTLILASRRAIWMSAWLDSAGQPVDWIGKLSQLGVSVVAAPAMPINLGAGTNEDRVLALRKSEVHMLTDAPILSVQEDTPLAANLQARFIARAYVAIIVAQLTACSVMAGTGLIGPMTY